MVGVALLVAAVGFAQFSPAAALADVAEHFGDLRDGDSVAEQAGLPGTVLGAGLATIRLSALAALPLAALADRLGRRRTVLAWASLGLAVTAAAAASPGYWWFVAAFACARPLLTATDTLGEVLAAEYTGVGDRARAIALVTAAYGFGAGAVAVLRGLAGDGLGFRAVFALAGALLVVVAVAARRITEPARFHPPGAVGGGHAGLAGVTVLRALGRPHRRRLAAVAGITFGAGLVTGPSSTFLFVYAENVLGVSAAVTGVLVVAAGAAGLGGLLLGRYLCDAAGRRVAGATALVLVAVAALVTYSGSVAALAVGYPLAVLAGGAFGPAGVAVATELFPTSVRATVAGWLVVAGVGGATTGLLLAGAVADATDSFSGAMAAVAVPGALLASLFALLPETRGLELEQSAPDPAAGPG